jgi:hypothetical protein
MIADLKDAADRAADTLEGPDLKEVYDRLRKLLNDAN